MLNELAFYEIDEQWLGSESEDYEVEDDQNPEERLQAIIKSSKRDDGEKELSPMEAALQAADEDHRLEEMEKAALEEMSINEYRVEPQTN